MKHSVHAHVEIMVDLEVGDYMHTSYLTEVTVVCTKITNHLH